MSSEKKNQRAIQVRIKKLVHGQSFHDAMIRIHFFYDPLKKKKTVYFNLL